MNLTPVRLEKIRPLLDESVQSLAATGNISPGFERQLRDTLKTTGYQSLKPLMVQLAGKRNDERYRLVALRYMESGVPGVVSEFQGTLAEAYGLRSYRVDRRLREFAKQLFWESRLPKLKSKKK